MKLPDKHAMLELTSLVFLTFFVTGAFCGCRDGGVYGDRLCCEGKDLTCRTDGYIQGQRYYSECYCDTACVANQDCCDDYRQACPGVDCQLSEWTPWSGCSVQCGIGVKERNRFKIREPVAAGKKCEALKEMKACYSSYCNQNEIHGNSVAMILPHYYGDRRDDPQLNLMHNFLNIGYPKFKSYCAYYKVTNFHKIGCRSNGVNSWTESISKGLIVCAQCEYPAYDDNGKCYGEGIQNKKSRWSAVDVPRCRGQWKQQSIVKDCTCNTGRDFIFI